jgi:4-hydroxybenzoate polyprenyltransferase
MSTAARSVPRSRAVRVPLAVLRAARPAEWIKNGFVLAPLIFSGRFNQADTAARAIVIMAAFCAVASAGYLLNDLLDVELDRQHPTKRHRPIASGELPESLARTLAFGFAVVGLGAGFAINWKAGALVGSYGILTVSYSLFLKHLVIIDVMTIVTLFVLRVLAGAVPLGIVVSHWLLVCTGMLSLFLGFTKRRQEAILEEQEATEAGTRPVLEHYSIPFLDQMIAMVTASAILSYVIYAANSPRVGSEMLATAPSVLYGIFRYLYLIYDRRDTRSTAAILTEDPGMVFAGVTWVASALAVLYLFD